ncbi:hypothetical protein AABB02_00060 [Streptomyces rimosus]|uniref:hypothetical protein n=1 Tax=Streptomyces rimosus TaxID=1927 RepID=UPI0031E37BD8
MQPRQQPDRPHPYRNQLPGGVGALEQSVRHTTAALTRRFEETAQKNDREFGIVKSDLTALRLQVGNLDQKLDNYIEESRRESQELRQAVESSQTQIIELRQEMNRNRAQIVELLSSLVGKSPDAS